jgi:hypothetical protein
MAEFGYDYVDSRSAHAARAVGLRKRTAVRHVRRVPQTVPCSCSALGHVKQTMGNEPPSLTVRALSHQETMTVARGKQARHGLANQLVPHQAGADLDLRVASIPARVIPDG